MQDLSREDLLVVLTFTLQDKQEMIEEQLRQNKLRADSLQKTDSPISDKSA